MSYLKKIEYEIVLKDSFWVIRNCPKCGRKTYFKNTKKFRVNANSNKLDIWLIYQCENCKHTLNLSIYERQKISCIPKEAYQYFLENNELFAEMYGKNIQLFQKNKADIDFEKLNYSFVKLHETIEYSDFQEQIIVTINNPHQLKIRPEKQIAEVLELSRNQVKSLLAKGEIEFKLQLPQLLRACLKHTL
ncbi:MAG: DUF1062 domain-containing protein [Lachnospiraceae bacterium]|jgi:Uncharacterized protein conserved in bacteria